MCLFHMSWTPAGSIWWIEGRIGSAANRQSQFTIPYTKTWLQFPPLAWRSLRCSAPLATDPTDFKSRFSMQWYPGSLRYTDKKLRGPGILCVSHPAALQVTSQLPHSERQRVKIVSSIAIVVGSTLIQAAAGASVTPKISLLRHSEIRIPSSPSHS
jgi:hypothetical protein